MNPRSPRSSVGLATLALALLPAACAGGGGGGGGGGPVDPPTGPTPFTPLAGLDGAAAGPGAIRVDFTLPPNAGHEVAVFVSTSRGNLFASTPHVPAALATTVTVQGLTDGIEHFIGLGVRPTTGGPYRQAGPILTATPGAPLFVDAAAPAGGDGSTPATAFNDLLTAVFTAFAQLITTPGVSVNVWVKEGAYDVSSTLPVTGGVNIYGGFGAAFDLASRDVVNTPTVWNVLLGRKGVEYGDQLDNSLPVVVDGVRILGNDVGEVGFDTDGTDPCPLELRSVVVTRMRDRGMRLRNVIDAGFDVVVTNCEATRNGADGLSGSGAFDYFVHNSLFASNFQEGLDLDALVPETGGTATLEVTSSQFFGNGSEGLDCTMRPPLTPTNGAFAVRVRASAFERNAQSGCLIDGDFELFAGYSAEIVVRESRARGNAGHGFHLDLDGPLDLTQDLTAFLYRVLASSNAMDGLYVSSESRPGLTVVSTSALVGNVGAGLRAEGPPASPGNRALALTHCLFAGNFGGGLISRDIPASAASSIAYLQGSPFDASTLQRGDVISSSPAAVGFTNAPEEYARVLSRSQAVLGLAASPGFSPAFLLELADDGVERSAASIAGTSVTLDEAPEDFGVPGLLAAFAPGAPGVGEDYELLPGSIALAAGLNGADAGPHGSAAPGAPGMADEIPLPLLYPVAVEPTPGEVVGSMQAITITFSAVLQGSSANGTTVQALRGSTPLGISLMTSGAELTIAAPLGGWGAGDFRVELDGLLASDGTELSGALALPCTR